MREEAWQTQIVSDRDIDGLRVCGQQEPRNPQPNHQEAAQCVLGKHVIVPGEHLIFDNPPSNSAFTPPSPNRGYPPGSSPPSPPNHPCYLAATPTLSGVSNGLPPPDPDPNHIFSYEDINYHRTVYVRIRARAPSTTKISGHLDPVNFHPSNSTRVSISHSTSRIPPDIIGRICF